MFRKGKKHSNLSFKKPFGNSTSLSPARLKALKKVGNKDIRHLSLDFELPVGNFYKKITDSKKFKRHTGCLHGYFGDKKNLTSK